MGYGFMEWDRSGHRVIGHTGNSVGTMTSLGLLPDDGVGLFVTYNADTARPLTTEGVTLNAFLDHFYPPPPRPALVPPADFASRAAEFTGEYRRNNLAGSVTTIEKLIRLLAPSTRMITAPGDGTLEVSTLAGSARFVEVAPLYFRQVGGQDALLFRRDASGRISRAFFSGLPFYTFEKLAWCDAPALHLGALATTVVVFISVIVAVPIGWLTRRWRGRQTAAPRVGRYARLVLVAVAILNLAFLIAFYLELADPALVFGDFARLRPLLMLPLVSAPLSLGALGGVVVAWRRRYWSLPGRLHYSLGVLAALGFLVILNHWNLLGFHL
jgi:hypothetical protein